MRGERTMYFLGGICSFQVTKKQGLTNPDHVNTKSSTKMSLVQSCNQEFSLLSRQIQYYHEAALPSSCLIHVQMRTLWLDD